MSQQLTFLLKYKKDLSVTVTLGWFSTTPARTIGSKTDLRYTSDDVLIKEDLIEKTITLLQETINSYLKEEDSIKTRILDLKTLLCECNRSELVSQLLDNIDTCQNEIKSYQDEIEEYQCYIDKLRFILSSYIENKTDWDLYYWNC